MAIRSNFWDITNKPQTKTKLKILGDYLSAWAKILANQSWCKEMYYVDCFAGRGKYHCDGKKDSVLGSPLMALEIARSIKEQKGKNLNCIFIEEDEQTFLELSKFIEPYRNQGLSVKILRGDINEKIDDVLGIISGRAPIFFFIDPAGINISREMLKKTLEIPNVAKEYLINYICKGVERCYALGKKCNEELPVHMHKMAIGNLRRIQDFFGDDWKLLSDKEKNNLKVYLNIFANHNDKVAEKHQLKAKVIDICYNKGRNKYYLIFLSRNTGAKGIIEDIFKKVKSEGTLFQNLPKREKDNMFQGTFDI
jgi:three-Cys-motif partner protein